MEKKYTTEDLIDACNEERERVRIILEYILNKHSKTIAEGGFDYESCIDEIQDFEHSLQ